MAGKEIRRGAKALQNAKAKGGARPKVLKGIYVYEDQFENMLMLSTQNKIEGSGPTSSSEIVREALDRYLKTKMKKQA